MSAKRFVKLTAGVIRIPATDEKAVVITATTKVGNNTYTGRGANDAEAVKDLAKKVDERKARDELQAKYPKTITVPW